MADRAIWKGTLKLALVTIPIKVYPATSESDGVRFNQLHETCSTRIQQRKWCPTCAREVTSAEIVKGYEFETGKYVILSADELDAVSPPSTRVIDLVQFAPMAALEPRIVDRAYFLAPDGELASEAYALLCDAMATIAGAAANGRIGLGKLAIYGREYLVAVAEQRQTLLLYTLHHAAELRASPQVTAPVRPFIAGGAEVGLARQVITAMTRPLDLSAFTDAFQADVRRLIDAKIAGQEIVFPPLTPPTVLPLRAALEQSLAAAVRTKPTPAKATLPAKRKRA